MSTPCPWGKISLNLSEKKLTTEEKTWIARQIIDGKYTAKYFHEKYQLNRKTVTTWAEKVQKGQKIHDGKGQPRKITSEMKRKVEEFVESDVYLKQPHEIEEKLQELVDIELENRGFVPATFSKLDKKTFKRTKIELGLESGNAEFTTTARADATASVRNLLSHAVQVCHQTDVRKVPRCLHLNADGSTFTVGYSADNKIEVIFIKKEQSIPDDADNYKQALPKKGEHQMGLYTVKIYVYISAEGVAFDPIFIIQDDTMEVDDMDVHEVNGLGLGTNWDSKGYIVFMKSRAGHAKFYKWFFEHIHIKSVKNLREFYKIPETTAANLQIDGEDVQIGCLKDEDLLALLRDLNIDVTKSFHSGTATTQPCDAGNMFIGSKKVNKHLKDGEILNKDLLQRVKEVFKLHNRLMNPAQEQPSTASKKGRKPKRTLGVSDTHCRMGAVGILRVQYSFQVSCNPRTIHKSFKITGNVPYNLKHIFSLLRVPPDKRVKSEEFATIEACFPELLRRYGLQGELYESDFDEFDIRPDRNPGIVPRDQRILCQRRSVNLTHPRVRERLNEQAAEKEQQAIAIENEKVTRAVEKKRKKEEKEQKLAAKKAKVAK